MPETKGGQERSTAELHTLFVLDPIESHAIDRDTLTPVRKVHVILKLVKGCSRNPKTSMQTM